MPRGLLQRNGRHLTILRISQRRIKRASKPPPTSLEGQLTPKWVNAVNTWSHATFFKSSQSSTNAESESVTSLREATTIELNDINCSHDLLLVWRIFARVISSIAPRLPSPSICSCAQKGKRKDKNAAELRAFLEKPPKYIDLKKY